MNLAPSSVGHSPSRRRQNGAALVVAMLIFALCTALIVAMKREFTLSYQRGANLFVAEQAYAYLRGAEDLAFVLLALDYDQDQARDPDEPRDDFDETWANIGGQRKELEGSWLEASLIDLQGRFNLNSLKPAGSSKVGSGERKWSIQEQQFIRLLQTLQNTDVSQELAKQITDAVVDWQDADDTRRPYGAEDQHYLAETPSYRAANRPLQSVTELRAVAFVTPEIYTELKALVTVWPANDDAKINIHTAVAGVLRTFNEDGNLAPLNLAEAELLVSDRQEQPFANLDAFLQHSVFTGKTLDKLKDQLGESSSYFLLDAKTEVADRTVRLYSVLQRTDRKVEVLLRVNASVYFNNDI